MADRVLSGRYRVVRHLARGGMAEVYVAQDELLSRTVAVKVLFPELAQDDQFVERFRREARAAASLNHHNIVSVYDFGDDDDSWFIVMEYVDGPTLRDIIRSEGAMEPTRAAAIAAEVAAALAVAHAQGIIHRDVKPANVLIAEPEGTVKVTDFGIARAANARQALTLPGTVLGTATYLSPEQAQGAEVDKRTDIYSLGMVLYEMLSGKSPFTGDSPVAIAYQAVRETPPPPSTHNAQVPPALDALVMKAMSKDPAGRFASASEMRSALLNIGRAVGDPEATVAIASPAVEPTAVVAPSTSILPPATEVVAGSPVDEPPPRRAPVAAAPVPDAVYRRRRAAVVGGLLLLAALVVVLIVALSGGGSKVKVPVPDVTGKALADAQAALDAQGLKSDVRQEDRPGAAGSVVAQDPVGGTQVNKGSTVKLITPAAATSTTAQSAQTTPPATTATTRASTTTTTAPTTTTTRAPTTTTPPTTAAPPTTVVATTVAVTTTAP